MTWVTPAFSRSVVDRAGRVVAGREAGNLDDALLVVNNWRASHSFPLNTFQMGLRGKARQVYPSAVVAQRIKRLSSIKQKLERETSMQLSQMQDVGGCRAVLQDVAEVCRVRDLYEASSFKHRLVKENDYIASPKTSGYRGIHRVYRYTSDRSKTYNNLQIEVQLRSQLQHAWATAVETVGTFLEQALKASQGPEEWLRLFVLMSSALALREKTELAPDTPTSRVALVRELKGYVRRLDVEKKLALYHATVSLVSQPEVRGSKYFLVELQPARGQVRVTSYREKELPQASADYLAVERSLTAPGSEAVLVSVESIDALRRAYPNYFLDTGLFVAAMKTAIS